MKVLIKAMAGSHLFGTNTPESDKDYKGVFLPTKDEILLGQYKESVSVSTGDNDSKNSSDDMDIEMYSLKKFFKMLDNGDTAALELLFTPEEFIIEKDPLWDEIIINRDQFLSCRVKAMIGYARQQANKYGIKGSRMGELSNCIEALKEIQKEFEFANPKLKHGWDLINDKLKDYDHVHFIELSMSNGTENTMTPALDILGKKFDYHCSFIYVLEILKKIYKNYGYRARQAKKNNGIDWKALSHAVRVSLQGVELLETGKITLPLKSAHQKVVRDIKMGEIDYKVVGENIEDLLNTLEKASKNSKLPERVDKEFLDGFMIDMHHRVILEG